MGWAAKRIRKWLCQLLRAVSLLFIQSACRVLRNTYGTYACPAFAAAASQKVIQNWPGGMTRWQDLLSPGKHGMSVVCICCCLGSKELLSTDSFFFFLWVLTEKSHNWTPKANVLLVKNIDGSKFSCSPNSGSCSSLSRGFAKRTSLPEPGSQVAILGREQLAGAQMRCNHYQFLKKDLKT